MAKQVPDKVCNVRSLLAELLDTKRVTRRHCPAPLFFDDQNILHDQNDEECYHRNDREDGQNDREHGQLDHSEKLESMILKRRRRRRDRVKKRRWSCQVFRSIDAHSAIFTSESITRPKSPSSSDKSIQQAYLYHIHRAKKFVKN